MSKKKKNGWGTAALFIVVVAVAVLVALGLSQLFKAEEVRTSENNTSDRTNMLVCTAGENDDMFFKREGAEDVKQEIKVAYSGDNATELFYAYEADFGSPEGSNEANADLHAAYNIFMGKNVDDFTDQFMEIGDKLKVTVHSEADKLGSQTSKIFFISEEEFRDLDGFKIDELEKIFKKKGFSCDRDDD